MSSYSLTWLPIVNTASAIVRTRGDGAMYRGKGRERQQLADFDTIRLGILNGWGRLYGFQERDCGGEECAEVVVG